MISEIRFIGPVLKNIKCMKRRRNHFDRQLAKALRMLAEDLTYPGLKVHPLASYPGWKEAYINKSDRLVFTIREDKIWLCWCGDHDELMQQAFALAIHQAEAVFSGQE